MNRNEKIIILLFSIDLFVSFFLLIDLPFFWDAISKSQRADWIYSTNFSSLIVPTAINSGHPPLWTTSIAIFWTLFGKLLWPARLLLLLVNFGVFYQLLILARTHFTETASIFLILLVFIEPSLIANTTMLNNDMMLLFFTLLGINALFNNRYWFYTIALVGLLMTNLRGIYCFIALSGIHLWLIKAELLVFEKKMLRAYSIGILIFIAFAFYQNAQIGWFIITENEGFSKHRELTGINRIFRNTAVFIKNILEFGRLVVWIPLTFMIYYFLKKKSLKNTDKSMRLLIALVMFTAVFFIGMVPFGNPIGTRYFLICFVLANFLFINLMVDQIQSLAYRRIIVLVVSVSFITGHLWIYPATLSQAWDSSLAYLNYYSQEDKMVSFIEEQGISKSEIGTNIRINSTWIATLDESDKERMTFIDFDLNTNNYILFSNIENITKDDEIKILRNDWIMIKSFSQLGVFMTLYKNPRIN